MSYRALNLEPRLNYKMAAGEGETLKSLDDDCTKLRTMYDSCFNKWFSEEFLKGVQSDHQTVCGELFNAYLKCLKVCL